MYSKYSNTYCLAPALCKSVLLQSDDINLIDAYRIAKERLLVEHFAVFSPFLLSSFFSLKAQNERSNFFKNK